MSGNKEKPSLLAQILFHGASLGQSGAQAIAQSATPKRRRKGGSGGCTPCAAKARGAAMVKRSGV
jgi:hypothetical protein